ncbi:MAG: FAD binding domain-containing protein [Betaproteobacteria bacterium]
MKPPPFDYYAPAALDEALALLDRLGDGARLLAGGQSLIPLLNMRLARPQALVDLNRVPGLGDIRVEGHELVLGAMVRHRQLERDPLVRKHVPLLAEAARHIAHVQIRTRGTLGGSLANAAPAAELPAVVMALDATLVARSSGGSRKLAPAAFFVAALQNALAPNEMLAQVRVPIPAAGTGWAFVEFARRRGDFALAGAAVLGRRVALCGVADLPVLLEDVHPDRSESAVRAAVRPRADVHLSAESRVEIAVEIARRALSKAAGR